MRIRQCIRNGAIAAGVAAMLPAGILTSTARADQNIFKDDRTSLDVGLEVGAGIFHSSEDYSGQGRDDVTWQEWYVKPSVSATFSPSTDWGTFYGKVSGMFTATTGDGDAAGFTTGDEAKVDLEDAYAGWRSGERFPELGEDAFDISGGAQYFEIGDGFLIAGDPLSLGDGLDSSLDRGGAFWYAARKVFPEDRHFPIQTGTLLRGDVMFYLSSDNKDRPRPSWQESISRESMPTWARSAFPG
ncbi:MAG: hypothetical protein KIT00_02290 [Rhodospirillales bacterium]|nr:hypothetical protein [Rhodospirillales bacterium]